MHPEMNRRTPHRALPSRILASSGKTIESPGYRVDIPKDWEMKSSAADPILENKEETLQISIMVKVPLPRIGKNMPKPPATA